MTETYTSFLKACKENNWLYSGLIYIGNIAEVKRLLHKKCSYKVVDVKIHFVDYKQSDLFGEVHHSRKKESVKRKIILVRHGTLEVRYADIDFFPLILFLYLRDGLRRKGGGDCSLSIPPET